MNVKTELTPFTAISNPRMNQHYRYKGCETLVHPKNVIKGVCFQSISGFIYLHALN